MSTQVLTRQRSVALDGLRGWACVFMLFDHVLIVTDAADWTRWTLGRLAMPVFFVLAGHLAGRLSARHLQAAALGLALPVFVPWIDAPNVLLYWALGSVVLWAASRADVPVWGVPLLCLALAANNITLQEGTGYPWVALLGLMGLGAMIPRLDLERLGRSPAWVAYIGARPLTFYVGHLLVLQAATLLLTAQS